MKRVLMAATVAAGLAAAPAFASGLQNGTAAKPDQAEKAKPVADHAFVTDAAKGGMAEVELGKLAAEKGSSAQVKQFGQRMVDDHSKANDELKALAAKKNIALPTDIDAKDKELHSRLSKLSGAEFDRVYMQAMLKDHRKDVNEFKKESTSGKDPDVKQFAAKTLPTLEDHLKMAESGTRAVGTSGTADHATPHQPTDTAAPAPKSGTSPR
jgi:putative membrane protein